jgi:hypothetical protein
LFTYFETKTELLNQLYLELKGEMAAAALKGLPARAEPRERFFWRLAKLDKLGSCVP